MLLFSLGSDPSLLPQRPEVVLKGALNLGPKGNSGPLGKRLGEDLRAGFQRLLVEGWSVQHAAALEPPAVEIDRNPSWQRLSRGAIKPNRSPALGLNVARPSLTRKAHKLPRSP